MKISEAVKMATDRGACIARGSVYEEDQKGLVRIFPTNSYECCVLICSDGKRDRKGRCWNPTVDDLLADDWIIVDPITGDPLDERSVTP